jgi:hypothetical protein
MVVVGHVRRWWCVSPVPCGLPGSLRVPGFMIMVRDDATRDENKKDKKRGKEQKKQVLKIYGYKKRCSLKKVLAKRCYD